MSILTIKHVCESMKTQPKTRQVETGIITKHGRLTFNEIGNLIKFRQHAARPVNLQHTFPKSAVGTRVEEKMAFELEAERRRQMGRTYLNMMPPR